MTEPANISADVFADVVRIFDSPVLLVDRARRIRFINPAARTWLRVDTDDVQGRGVGEVLGLNRKNCDKIFPADGASPDTDSSVWHEYVCGLSKSRSGRARFRCRSLGIPAGEHLHLLMIEEPDEWQQRYADVMEASPLLFFEMDEQGRILDGSKGLAEALQLGARIPRDRTLFDLAGDHQRDMLAEIWSGLMNGRAMRRREISLIDGRGEERHFWMTFLPVREASGGAPRVRGIASDVRTHRGLAYALEAAEERFNVLFRESSDPVLILSMKGEILSANISFEQFTGLRTEDLFSGAKGWADCVHPDDLPLLQERIARCADDGVDSMVEVRLAGVQGQMTWFEQSLSVLHDEAGRARGLVSVLRNIDQRKERELQLREKARSMQRRHQRAQLLIAKLKHFFSRASSLPSDIDGYLKGLCDVLQDMYNPYFVCINVHDKEHKMFHAGADPSSAMLDEQGQPRDGAMCVTVMETGLPLYSNTLDATEPYCSDPMVTHLKLRTYIGAPLRDSTGRVRGTLALCDVEKQVFDNVDVELITVAALHIAARLRAEEQEEVNRELADHLRQAQKMEAVGLLAGGVAHDFNNILSGILGFSSYLLSKVDSESTIHRDLKLIEQSAVRASDLTRQLLAFARRKHFVKEPVSMNQVIGDVLILIQRSFAKNIVIQYSLAGDLPPVLGDPGQLNQVIMNLCLNAADAMSEKGGTLTLATEHRTLSPRERKTLVGSRDGEYVCVTVSDSGVGIPPEVQEHIFEPFYTTKGGGQGTGLGLSIVYGIVSNHEGHVTVDSVPGEGSHFTLFIPVCHGERRATEEDAPTPTGGHETILVVDDELIVRQMVMEVMRDAGYQVVAAESGKEAVHYVRELGDRIDLVLLDMIMPGMNGEATYQAMRRIRPDIPVLLTSGFVQESCSDRLIEQGALGLMYKPYTSDALLKRIRQALDQHAALSADSARA